MNSAEQLNELARIDCPSYRHMEEQERADGILTMLNDLNQLARRDGCIAAAWALEMIQAMHAEVERLRHTADRFEKLMGAVVKIKELLRHDSNIVPYDDVDGSQSAARNKACKILALIADAEAELALRQLGEGGTGE